LGQIIYTTSFYDKVIQSKYLPAAVSFPSDEQQRRSEWKRRIDTRVMPDIGQMKISVYDRSRDNATDLANALAMVLSEQGTEYLGGSDGVTLKVVDYPLTSKRPDRPNIPLNVVAGFLLGGGAATGYFTARSVRRQNESKRAPAIPFTPLESEHAVSEQSRLSYRKNAPASERVPVAMEQPNQYMFQNQYTQVPTTERPDLGRARPDDSTAIHTLHDQYRPSQSAEAKPSLPSQSDTVLPEEEFRNFE
jgi:hypothetical protein